MMKAFEPTKFAQQVIDFQRTAFENSFNAMVVFQGQAEKMTDTWLTKNSMIPEEGQKAISEWILACKKGRDEFKKAVDENFRKMETFVDTTAKAK